MSSLSAALRDRLWAFTRPRIDRLHYTGGGLGDELMFTAVVAEARRTGRPLHVLTDKPEVWEGNTDPASVQTGIEKWFRAKDRGRLATEIIHLSYANSIHVHLADQMATIVGVELPSEWAPVFHARRSTVVAGGAIVIQNSCRGALYAATTKEWPFDRWDRLAERLVSKGHCLVQIGTPQDPLVPGVVDLRGKTDLAQAAAMFAQAKLFIGLESGLMHLAAAVRVPTVIIYGGRTRPWETGYTWHWHAANTTISCSGCALNIGCPHDVNCMKEIEVDEVESLVDRALAGDSAPGFRRRLHSTTA